MGWSAELLAGQLGRRPSSLCRSVFSGTITSRTAQDVAALYEQLWELAPPRMTLEQRAAADAAEACAAVGGWPPPLAWDDIDTDPTPPPTTRSPAPDDIDEIAVERALAGDSVSDDDLTSAEQQEVVRRLTARGSSIRDIAAQLGTTKRTVSRRRAAIGAA
ncbi:hypothetical protein OF117_10530 [Geodermatophilus sp. YIM 151500]|uniref:hypothetical protein n=1 Tax=Geodermatophilus sp. YIM 151500 TaxID=2984531 RepID=UPI0021E46C70|nr:hypothetical protein [Geodermatophilus sp. YIM 151500]MCV2489797.1 hypothetical protein [Geodermatophilus sp. YIM 151500]